jgi:hypothetical protein
MKTRSGSAWLVARIRERKKEKTRLFMDGGGIRVGCGEGDR